MFGFSCNSTITITHHIYLIFKIKASISFECKHQITLATFLVFVDVNENLIMANDVARTLNPLVTLVEGKELEKN
jgi:hypothetical protein